MKGYDWFLAFLGFASVGFFAGSLLTFSSIAKRFYLTAKEKK